MTTFRDPANGKLYSFEHQGLVEWYDGPKEREYCAVCGSEVERGGVYHDGPEQGEHGLLTCHECARPEWPGSWGDVFRRWSDF